MIVYPAIKLMSKYSHSDFKVVSDLRKERILLNIILPGKTERNSG